MTVSTFVETSVARHMLSRMHATHLRRRIAVFSGPPGIGKTTTIDRFRTLFPNEVLITKVARKSAREIFALQLVLEALLQALGTTCWIPTSLRELRQAISRSLCEWTGSDTLAARRGEPHGAELPRRTLVFDEAQNLSREAIELLRYWNDADRCYSPFPLGLIFVGNAEFSLAEAGGRVSPLSAAVADRAYHIQTLEYDDLSDEDLRLFIMAQGIADQGAVALILRQLRAQRAVRSLRRLSDLIQDLQDEAGEQRVTSETVRAVLQPA